MSAAAGALCGLCEAPENRPSRPGATVSNCLLLDARCDAAGGFHQKVLPDLDMVVRFGEAFLSVHASSHDIANKYRKRFQPEVLTKFRDKANPNWRQTHRHCRRGLVAFIKDMNELDKAALDKLSTWVPSATPARRRSFSRRRQSFSEAGGAELGVPHRPVTRKRSNSACVAGVGLHTAMPPPAASPPTLAPYRSRRNTICGDPTAVAAKRIRTNGPPGPATVFNPFARGSPSMYPAAASSGVTTPMDPTAAAALLGSLSPTISPRLIPLLLAAAPERELLLSQKATPHAPEPAVRSLRPPANTPSTQSPSPPSFDGLASVLFPPPGVVCSMPAPAPHPPPSA